MVSDIIIMVHIEHLPTLRQVCGLLVRCATLNSENVGIVTHPNMEFLSTIRCINVVPSFSVFHRDASPRVGCAHPLHPTHPGWGDSRGCVTPRPPFGETWGDARGCVSPGWETRLAERGTFGRPPKNGVLLGIPPQNCGSSGHPPFIFV